MNKIISCDFDFHICKRGMIMLSLPLTPSHPLKIGKRMGGCSCTVASGCTSVIDV